jgi:hypothetical protein
MSDRFALLQKVAVQEPLTVSEFRTLGVALGLAPEQIAAAALSFPSAPPRPNLDAAVIEIAARQWDACEDDDGLFATATRDMVKRVLEAYIAMKDAGR